MRFFLAIVLFAVSLLGSCNNTNTNVNSNSANANKPPTLPQVVPIVPTSAIDPGFKSCNPYYPLVPGSQMKYRLKFSSGLLADMTVVVDSADEAGQKTFVETTQIVDNGGGVEKLEKTIRKYVCDGERIRIIYEKGNNRAGELANDIELKFRNIAILVVDPAALKRVGSTWSYSFNQIFQVAGQPPLEPQEPVSVGFEVLGEEEVTIPAGKFKAVKLARKVKDKQGTDYLVKGIGLVRQVAYDGTTRELREYSGLKPLD